MILGWSQSAIIFPTHAVPAPGPLPPGAQRLTVATVDGETVHGVVLPPAEATAEALLVIGFGGNAWNGEDVAAYLHELYPTAHVAAFHYRGYRPSTGTPSAEALLADAPLVTDSAVARIRPERIVAVGFSIGSGVAARLAAERSLDGLILVTPFDSLKAVAQAAFPWLPLGPLFEHEIDAAGALQESRVPVAIIAAERDEIIPAERTEALLERTGNAVFHRTIAGAGHNDLYAREDFREAMREALHTLERGGDANRD